MQWLMTYRNCLNEACYKNKFKNSKSLCLLISWKTINIIANSLCLSLIYASLSIVANQKRLKINMVSSGYQHCTTSFIKAWTQVLRRFKSCSRHAGDSRWWGSLTMVSAENKANTFTPFVGQPDHKNNSWYIYISRG